MHARAYGAPGGCVVDSAPAMKGTCEVPMATGVGKGGRLVAAVLAAAALGLLAAAAAGPGAVWPVPAGTAAGNRVQTQGRGTFPAFQILRAPTGKAIAWLVAGPLAAGEPARLIGSRADATLVAYAVERGSLRLLFEIPEGTSPDAAPAVPVVTRGGERAVVAAALDGSLTVVWGGHEARVPLAVTLSPLAHLVPVDVDGDGIEELLALSREGELLLIGGLPEHARVTARLALHTTPDAHIVVGDLDGNGRPEAVLLTGPTDRYPHGALGDAIETETLTVVELGAGLLRERARFTLPADAVFEDLGPILADLDGDGRPEILVVRSTQSQGAAVVAFAWRGGRLEPFAEGPALGKFGRWIHLLGVADMEGAGRPQVVGMRTPDANGVLQVFDVAPPRLALRTERSGGSTHAFGSRNLDQVALADLAGNGHPQIVVPHGRRRRIVAMEWLGGGLLERWGYELGGPIASNLVVADLAGGGLLDLAVADAGGNLHVLLSRR